MSVSDVVGKNCSHCGEWKARDGFDPSRTARDGLSSWCKTCKRQQSRDARRTGQPTGRRPTHGHRMSRRSTPTYRSWVAMIERCTNSKHHKWADYGGRGITVCERWRRSFEAFLADMGERPDRKTLDRIDPDGDYEPGNCRWATAGEQARNRRPRRKAAA